MYQCKNCNRKYKTLKKFEEHQATHNNNTIVNLRTRNYVPPPKEKRTVKLHNCPACAKKYRSTEKLKGHIETVHYYDTRSIWFNKIKDGRLIFKLAADYIDIINHIKNMNRQEFVAKVMKRQCKLYTATANLLPQLAGNIPDDDLYRIAKAHHSFAQRIFNENILNECDWDKVLSDLNNFFSMGLPYYDTNFNPSLYIDFLWHSIMQNPLAYKQLFRNNPIAHCTEKRSEDLDTERFSYFMRVYKHKFKLEPYIGPVSTTTDPVLARERLLNKIDEITKQKAAKNAELERKKAEAIAIEIEMQKRIAIERIEKTREIQAFSEKVGIHLEINDWGENYDYEYYKRLHTETGLVGDALRKLLQQCEAIERARHIPSSC